MASDPLVDGSGLRREHYLGASSEYLAAAHFLANGWQVYWPSVQQSWVDFVSDRGFGLRRVQVKTATWNRAKTHHYLQCRLRHGVADTTPLVERYDDLVVVHETDCWIIEAEALDTSNLCLGTTRVGGKVSRWEPRRRPLLSLARGAFLQHRTAESPSA